MRPKQVNFELVCEEELVDLSSNSDSFLPLMFNQIDFERLLNPTIVYQSQLIFSPFGNQINDDCHTILFTIQNKNYRLTIKRNFFVKHNAASVDYFQLWNYLTKALALGGKEIIDYCSAENEKINALLQIDIFLSVEAQKTMEILTAKHLFFENLSLLRKYDERVSFSFSTSDGELSKAECFKGHTPYFVFLVDSLSYEDSNTNFDIYDNLFFAIEKVLAKTYRDISFRNLANQTNSYHFLFEILLNQFVNSTNYKLQATFNEDIRICPDYLNQFNLSFIHF